MKKTPFVLLLFVLLSSFSWAQPYGTGLDFDDSGYEVQPVKATLTRSLFGAALPASSSLKQYAPTPKSQGQYGTCVAWSTAYAAFSIIDNKKDNITNQARKDANTYSPPFIYRQISQDYSCQSGTNIHLALEVLRDKGVPTFSAYSPMCADAQLPASLFQAALKNRIKDFARLFAIGNDNPYKIETTKKALAEGNPVVIGMKIPQSFYNARNVWQPTEDPFANYGGHAMCVVGYDDNQFGGAFEIMNSWGTNWGNSGYIWVKYSDYANFTKYAYELFDFPAPAPEVFDLSGSIKLLLGNGDEMGVRLAGDMYKCRDAYRSGTSFRIYISNNEPAYVYAFGTDATKSTFQIFPHGPYVSPALNYKKSNVAIPDEEHFIQMDNTVGTDYLFVLYSKKSLDLNLIRKRFEQAEGQPMEKLKYALGSDLVPMSQTEYIEGAMKFRAKSQGKSVVALAVATTHLP